MPAGQHFQPQADGKFLARNDRIDVRQQGRFDELFTIVNLPRRTGANNHERQRRKEFSHSSPVTSRGLGFNEETALPVDALTPRANF